MFLFSPFFAGLLLILLDPAAGLAQSAPPFIPGEKLEYEMRWSFIKAGTAIVTVQPLAIWKGEPVYHFTLTAETTSFLDTFYKVRNRIDSYTDIHITRTVHYTKKQLEGDSRRDITVEFDWDKNQAVYTNFGKSKPPVDLKPGTFDPLGAFYYSRFFPLKVGTQLEIPVTDGKKCVLGRASVIRKETITVPAGTFKTFVLEPELKHLGGVFEKSDDAKITLWVSEDANWFPVRIKSKVVVGSFIGELVHLEGVAR